MFDSNTDHHIQKWQAQKQFPLQSVGIIPGQNLSQKALKIFSVIRFLMTNVKYLETNSVSHEDKPDTIDTALKEAK